MKTRTKALILAMCAVLLVAATVMVTVAFLTSQTDVVKNTFTVGNVKITLDEAPVDADGKETDGKRVIENKYHLFPGKTYDKDPTIHVDAKSENCWLFVKVVDEIADIQDDTTVSAQMTANGWILVDGETNVYAYKEEAVAGKDYVLFESFKIKGDVDNTALAEYDGKTVKVEAYAVQAEGFTTAAAAWEAAPNSWKMDAPVTSEAQTN